MKKSVSLLITVLAVSFISCLALAKNKKKKAIILTYKINSGSETDNRSLMKFWIQSDIMRYYMIDSINDVEPSPGEPHQPISNSLEKDSAEQKVKITLGPANIQIKNMLTEQIYILIKEKNIAILEEPQTKTDSSAFFTVTYTKKYKLISGFKSQKIIFTNKLTKKEDSVYIAPELKKIRSPFYLINEKIGIKDFIVETYEHWRNTTFTVQLLKFEQRELPRSLFRIPDNYKIIKHNDYYRN